MYSIFYDPTHTRPFNDNFNSWMSLARSAFKYSISLSLHMYMHDIDLKTNTLPLFCLVCSSVVWLHAQMCLAAVESLFKITAFIRIFTVFFSSNINSAPLSSHSIAISFRRFYDFLIFLFFMFSHSLMNELAMIDQNFVVSFSTWFRSIQS